MSDPGPMARRTGEQTREVILEAAINRFGRDGFRATSVVDIARDAQVSGTAAYKYFSNKEELFHTALDQDTAGVIQDGVIDVLSELGDDDSTWQTTLLRTLVAAVDGHPLARWVLGGHEPHVTHRMLDIPAMVELRTMSADLIRAEQEAGRFRADVDPVAFASGMVIIWTSLLMAAVQFGEGAYGSDVVTVLQAAVAHVESDG